MSLIINYFTSLDIYGWLEILAMVVGFFYVFLQIKKTRKMWYFCIAASILNIFVYSHNHYLSMTVLQFYYIVTAIYGLWQWTKVVNDAVEQYGEIDRKHRKVVAIKHFNWKIGVPAILIAIALFFVLCPILKNYAEANGTAAFPSQPYWDALIAVGSMLGTFFLSRSYICQWYIWCVLDTITVVVFAYSGMYWMAALYVAYVVISIVGNVRWHKYGVYIK